MIAASLITPRERCAQVECSVPAGSPEKSVSTRTWPPSGGTSSEEKIAG